MRSTGAQVSWLRVRIIFMRTTKAMSARARTVALASALMMSTAFGQDAGVTALGQDAGGTTAQTPERPRSMFGSALSVTLPDGGDDGGAGAASFASGALLGGSAAPLDAGAVAIPSSVGPNEGYGGAGVSGTNLVPGTQGVAEDAGMAEGSAAPYPAGSTVPVPAAGSAPVEAPDGGAIDQSPEAPRPPGSGSEQR